MQDLSISQVIDHVGITGFHSDWRANLVKDFFEKNNFPPMGALQFIAGHMML